MTAPLDDADELAEDVSASEPHEATSSFDAPTTPDGRGRVATKPDAEHRIGRYRLVEQLASGGMATVYFAIDVDTGEPVAIKRVHAHLSNDRGFMAMFRDEARIAMRMAHPNVCRVLDVGIDGMQSPFIAMEYLHGAALDACVRTARHSGGLLSNDERSLLAAYVASAAAAGLHAAHELRDDDGAPLHVVHRDVSPHNIVACRNGGVKVVDFGVAAAADRQHRTMTGQLKGKIAYMAPEQVRMQGTVDRRADVWALGVVLWELLTGKPLFSRKSEVHALVAVLEAPIPLPSAIAPWLPRALEAIVMRCLTRDAARRPQTAGELDAELRSWLCGRYGAEHLAAWMARAFPRLDDKLAELRTAGTTLLRAELETTAGDLETTKVVSRAPEGSSHMSVETERRAGYVAVTIRGRMDSAQDAEEYQRIIEDALAAAGSRALLMDNRAGDGATGEAHTSMWTWIRAHRCFDRLAFLVESPSLVRGINLAAAEYQVATRAFSDLDRAESWLLESLQRPPPSQ